MSSMPDPGVLYEALAADNGRMKDRRRLSYWCAVDRCLLLDAVDVLGTTLLHQKRFKQSDWVKDARSNAAGRAANTLDGGNHWQPRSYYLEQSALLHPEDVPLPVLEVQCDHIGEVPGTRIADVPPAVVLDENFRGTSVRPWMCCAEVGRCRSQRLSRCPSGSRQSSRSRGVGPSSTRATSSRATGAPTAQE